MRKYIIIPIVLVIAIAVFAQPITPSGTRFFKYLFDTPDSYTDQGGKGLRVNSAADALEFYTIVSGITGNYVATIADGTGIDGTASSVGATYTPTFDPTELGALTWSDGTNASNIWTFDVSGTDHTMTAGNGVMTFSKGLTITLDLIVSGGDITLGTTSIFSGGDTASLNNIDTLNPTTEATIEAAIDTLSNLTSIGTIATGVWQGTDVGVAHGGTGAGTFTDGGVLLGSGTNAITAMSVLADGAIIVGDNSTDPVALTAFTSSTGDLIHEAGGLEADVSGYTDGIYGMASGATLDIDTSAEVRAAIGDETGTGLLVFATAPTFTTSITITGADASPNAAGQIRYDSAVAGLDGGALVYYDDDEVKHLMDYVTAPTDAEDDYHLAYDKDTDLMYWKQDADSGGATAYDNIGNPTGAGSISFDDNETAIYTTAQDSAGSFFSLINSNATVSNQVYMLDIDYSADTTEDNADFIRLQDAGSTLIVFEEEGKITMTPSGVDDAVIISIVPSVALTQSDAAWYGIKIDGDALDPGDVDNMVVGIEVDLSGVDTTNNPYVEALELKMYVGGIAIHIEEGGVDHFYTIGGDAGATYAVYDIVVDGSSQAATSETHIIDVEVANGDPDGEIVAVSTHTYVAPIHQHIGTYTTPDQVGADSEAGFFDNSATDYIDGVDGIEQFTFDDDAIWISNAAVFHSLEVSMTSDATRSIVPTFWYWKDDTPDLWTEFHPLDTTEGFQHSGTISWDADDVPSWLSADVVELSAGDSSEAAAGYWIAIVRTVGSDPGTPTPTTVKTGTVVLYEWDETGAVDLLSLEADTITEGGNAVWNATETEIIDSDHYIDGSIDHEHLAADVISGMTNVTSEDADYILIWDVTDSALKKVDMGEVRGGGATAWDDISDPDAAATVDFTTYTQTIDIGVTDTGGSKSGLIIEATGLGVGSTNVEVLKITTTANDDGNYRPFTIFDDSEGGSPDLLFLIDWEGVLWLTYGGRIDNTTNNKFIFRENLDTFELFFTSDDIDMIWSDGVLNLRNMEDGIDAIVEIEGKDGGEKGILRVLSDGDDKHIELYHDDTDAHIISNSGDIHIEAVGGNINFGDDNIVTTGILGKWNIIGDADAAATVDFVTYTQTIDIGVTDVDGPKSGLVFDVTGLGVGGTDVIALEITTVANDDTDYIPIAIYDDSGVDNDLLFQVDYQGVATMHSAVLLDGGKIGQALGDGYISFEEAGDFFYMEFDTTDVTLIWSDGVLNLRNRENGTDAIVEIEGYNDGEKGILRVMSDGDDKYIELYHDDTDAQIVSSSGDLYLTAVGGDINLGDDNLTTTGTATFAGGTVTGTLDISGATVTMPKRTKNDDRFYLFNAWNPNALYDTDTQLCIEPNLPADITITEVTITLDADPTTELDWDLKWADAFIGLGTATLIVAIDTTNGTTDVDSGWNDNTIVAGKCLYIEFAADPDSNIKQAIVKIRYDFD